jgi:hypothetical protein
VQLSSAFTFQIFAKTQHFRSNKNFHDTAFQTQNTLKILSLFPLLHIFDSPLPTRYRLYFPKRYLVSILPFPEGALCVNILFLPSPINLNVWPLITTPMPSVYSSLFFLILETVSINHILVVRLEVTCLESLQILQQYTSSCSGFFCSLKAVSLI